MSCVAGWRFARLHYPPFSSGVLQRARTTRIYHDFTFADDGCRASQQRSETDLVWLQEWMHVFAPAARRARADTVSPERMRSTLLQYAALGA